VESIPLVRKVTLGTLAGEQYLDAIIDTGATWCIAPPSVARLFGFHSGNRLWQQPVNVVGGQVMMDVYQLDYLQVGSAKAYDVIFGVQSTGQATRFMLVGLTFIRQFKTTFDFENNKVLFDST
jgi:predicted aspartyl protease